MKYPNKTFVLEHSQDTHFGTSKHVVMVVGNTKETACQYLKDKLGFKGEPNDLIWLMDTNHPTLYDQRGLKPLVIQAKIIYNTSIIINVKQTTHGR